MKKKQCIQRSYSDWDKFNVEEELEKLDESKKGDNPKQPNDNEKKVSSNTGLEKLVSVSDLSERERQYVADMERSKGNEAFKAHDYEEAILYYTRSLSAYNSVVALNNRAQAYIKLKNYFAAVQDCNKVLLMDVNNLKALYRRGVALKETGMYDLAELDFKTLLELDAENKSAKDQLKELKKMRLTRPENKKVMIEEIKSDDTETQDTEMDQVDNVKCTRMKIEEVTSTENTEKLTNIKYNSSDEEDNSSHLPLKVKQMLQINKASRKQKNTLDKEINEMEIEKTPIREVKRKQQKVKVLENYKESSLTSNSVDKNVTKNNLSIRNNNVNNKEKLNAKFVHVDIDDSLINEKHPRKCSSENNQIKHVSSIRGEVDLKMTEKNEIGTNLEDDKNNISPGENIENESGASKPLKYLSEINCNSIIYEHQFENDKTKTHHISTESNTRKLNANKIDIELNKTFNSDGKIKQNPDLTKDKCIITDNLAFTQYELYKEKECETNDKELSDENFVGEVINNHKICKMKHTKDLFNEIIESSFNKDEDSSVINDNFNVREDICNVNDSSVIRLERKLSSNSDDSVEESTIESTSKETDENKTNYLDYLIKNDSHEKITSVISQTEKKARDYSDFPLINETYFSNEENSNISDSVINNAKTSIKKVTQTNINVENKFSIDCTRLQTEQSSTNEVNIYTTVDTINDNKLNNVQDNNSEPQVISDKNHDVKENYKIDNIDYIKYPKEEIKNEESIPNNTVENCNSEICETYIKKSYKELKNKSQILHYKNFVKAENYKTSDFEPFKYIKEEMKNGVCVSKDTEENRKSKFHKEIYDEVEDEFVDVENDYPLQETNILKSQTENEVYEVSMKKNSRDKIVKDDCKLENNSQWTFNKSDLFEEKTEEKKCLSNCVIKKDIHSSELSTMVLIEDDKISKSSFLENEVQYEKISPYEFLCTWCLNDDIATETKGVTAVEEGALKLLKLKPQDLPKIITNKLDTSMLIGILKAISMICKMGKYSEGEAYLLYLTQVPRIDIAAMLLSKEEVHDIYALFSTLAYENGLHMKYVDMILPTL